MMLLVIVIVCYFVIVRCDHHNNYIFVEHHMNWIEANEKCIEYNATLATISSLHDNDEALSACKSDSCWIGLSNVFGSYGFIDETALTYSSFCDAHLPSTSSILNCISITNDKDICTWNYNDCKDIKLPFLCNTASHITSPSTCNYFIDSSSLLPHPIDICNEDSMGMNTLYKCDSNGDGVNKYRHQHCIASMEDELEAHNESNVLINHLECTASVCTEYEIVSVIQYDYTKNNIGCTYNNMNKNDDDWIQIDLVIGSCFPSQEYYNLYTQLTCSDTQIDKLFYNDSDCTIFEFGATILSHNTCSSNELFGYEIAHCGEELIPLLSVDMAPNDYQYGYINDGKVSIPIHKCQSIYTYSMSYKYICIDSKQLVINRIWFDNTDCNGFHYFDITISLQSLVDFNCNNHQIGASIININYYQDVKDNNPSIIYTQSIIINQCFIMNSSYSFRYKCTDNITLHRLIYLGTDCSGNAVLHMDGVNDNGNNELIGIPKCNMNDSIIMNMGPSWTNLDLMDTHKKAKIFMFILLALFVATCLMFAVFGILVWNYFKTQKSNIHSKSRNRYKASRTRSDVEGGSSKTHTTKTQSRKRTETEPKSVISYDVEDHGDLPGIELYKARKRSSYSSPPVSEHTVTLPPLPRTPMLLPEHSDDTYTNTTNITNKGTMDMSRIMDGLESLRQFSEEYYESSNDDQQYVD